MAVPKINKDECTGCGDCVEACPAECITLVDEVAVIDEDECTECGACIDECPEECISE
ncbi:MAG: 4Fe-4S binding protein [Myxococcales bacterium]|nr:4Fe-4S binding protein [Myxococcales bacterium]